MFGFLSKTKSKEKSPEAKQALATAKPPTQDGLKDTLTDPLAQGAQKSREAPAQTQGDKSLAEKSQAEKPQGETEKQAEKEKETASGFLGRMFKTQTWKRNEATKKAATIKVQQILDEYWDAAYRFAITEKATENFDCYEAIKGNVTKSSIFNVWIDPKASNNVNIPGKVLNPLMELAAKGSFDQMDFAPTLRELETNMIDTLSRFQSSDAFIKAIMARM